MQDRYGHRISYLRVSITDRCNERCSYCMPQELQEWLPRHEILTYEETLRLIRIAAELGVSKMRITGGEPLTRRDRKSTRLNSSHDQISYAVFCLKKKKRRPERVAVLRLHSSRVDACR